MSKSEQAAVDFTPDELEAAGAVHAMPDPGYQWPENPSTLAALEHWQDIKLGVIIHWGIYSYIGQGGSWSLHRDRLGDFTDPPAEWKGSLDEYHTWYYDQARKFTGQDFCAEQWADICAEAGMKYVVFTTKHHDGFAMYDTQYSNCKCTSEDSGLGRDIFGEVVNAFRDRGLETGVYFSKADWNHPCYWNRALPLHDRFHNYDLVKNPKVWKTFVDFTHNQIEELLSNYGPMNVIWLDAGWVREPEEPIDISGIAKRAREIQPDILVVDREVHGPEENYRTPEQALPDSTLPYPWESCITWTRSWCSMCPDDAAKPTSEIISNLVKIVSRGGNYLVGIGPDATGKLSKHLVQGLQELGSWMKVNGEGIYGSRALTEPIEVNSDLLECYLVEKNKDLYLFGVPLQDTDIAGVQNEMQSEALVKISFFPQEVVIITANGPKKLNVEVETEDLSGEGIKFSKFRIPLEEVKYAAGVIIKR